MHVVSITPSGGQAFVLGDDSLALGPGEKRVLSIRPRFDGVLQRAAYVRGEAPENFDRANETTDIVVEVCYNFLTFSACLEFILGLQANVPRQGTLTITTTGGGTHTRYLVGCWCRPIEVVEHIGVTAIVRYQFTGGKLTTS